MPAATYSARATRRSSLGLIAALVTVALATTTLAVAPHTTTETVDTSPGGNAPVSFTDTAWLVSDAQIATSRRVCRRVWVGRGPHRHKVRRCGRIPSGTPNDATSGGTSSHPGGTSTPRPTSTSVTPLPPSHPPIEPPVIPTGTPTNPPVPGPPGGTMPPDPPQPWPAALPAATLGDPSDYTYVHPYENPDGTHPRWDPCQTIPWSYNPTGEPDTGGLALYQQAFAYMSQATGFTFTYIGQTSHRPLIDSVSTFPLERGIVVGWASEAEAIANSIPGGRGGPVGLSYHTDGALSIERGVAIVRARDGMTTASGFNNAGSLGSVIMHEIGHVLGLGHAREQTQLMFGSSRTIYDNTWPQRGDRAGLTAVGASRPCFAT